MNTLAHARTDLVNQSDRIGFFTVFVVAYFSFVHSCLLYMDPCSHIVLEFDSGL